MRKRVIFLPGDGIGPEITEAARAVLTYTAKRSGLELETEERLIGGACLDQFQVPIQEETLEKCKSADAVFLGAVGGSKWDQLPIEKRPEKGLLRIRKELGLYTNLRPVRIFSVLLNASAIKPEYLKDVDLLIVRELTGGLYFGTPKKIDENTSDPYAVDTLVYRRSEIERIAHVAFKSAQRRRKKVTSVDKANVLATSQLWRKTVESISQEYPDVKLEHMLVDNCAMQLIRNPGQFDVILTENTFGDILSDEASMLSGSLGMLPSASLGKTNALYEPIHGSAPDIAGKNLANPIAAVLSVAMMCRHSFGLEYAARAIENAVNKVLTLGFRTKDLATGGTRVLGTREMTEEILDKLDAHDFTPPFEEDKLRRNQSYWMLESMYVLSS